MRAARNVAMWAALFFWPSMIVLIPGCSVFTPAGTIPVSESLSKPAQAAQTAINEGNVLLIAFNRTVGQQKTDGIITAAERDAYLDKSDKLGADLDKAQAALRAGDLVTAQDKAELTKTLILALHREVAAKARGQ